ILIVSFLDAKSKEVANIFSDGHIQTRREAYDVITTIDPTNNALHAKILENQPFKSSGLLLFLIYTRRREQEANQDFGRRRGKKTAAHSYKPKRKPGTAQQHGRVRDFGGSSRRSRYRLEHEKKEDED